MGFDALNLCSSEGPPTISCKRWAAPDSRRAKSAGFAVTSMRAWVPPWSVRSRATNPISAPPTCGKVREAGCMVWVAVTVAVG